MLTIMGGVAQSERATMLEHQRESTVRVKAEGVCKAHMHAARTKAAEIAALEAEGLIEPRPGPLPCSLRVSVCGADALDTPIVSVESSFRVVYALPVRGW